MNRNKNWLSVPGGAGGDRRLRRALRIVSGKKEDMMPRRRREEMTLYFIGDGHGETTLIGSHEAFSDVGAGKTFPFGQELYEPEYRPSSKQESNRSVCYFLQHIRVQLSS
jgi:hypothetical protein